MRVTVLPSNFFGRPAQRYLHSSSANGSELRLPLGHVLVNWSAHGRCERKQTNVEANLAPVKVNHAAGAV
jgi:hypothetical protein